MSRLSLNDEMNIEVRVWLIAKGTDEPVTGAEYMVRLYDKDVFNDDFLGESSLDDRRPGKISYYQKTFCGLCNAR